MQGTLESCESFFGTRDIYEIFAIDRKASVAKIKKAYYKQALKVHPDRVPEEEKVQSTEKFKILAKVNEVLNDKSRRALYDEQGIIDDDDDDEKFGSAWHVAALYNIFKPISDSDIDNYRNHYVGSDLEKSDLKEAYVKGRGCINYMMEKVSFMGVEDEPRFHEIIDEWIKSNEVEDFQSFTNEPKEKRDRRHKKYARESKLAEKMEKLTKKTHQKIMKRNARAANFFDKLNQKYMNRDNMDEDTDESDYSP